MKVDPLHAPLYHSLAELEARVFNIQGLAELNKRAAQIFNNNALEPPISPITMNLLGSKLKKSALSKKKIPNNINLLARKTNYSSSTDISNIEEKKLNVEETIMDMNPDLIIDNMIQLENDVLVDIFADI